MTPHVLLLDVMGTLVYDPFFVEVPRHFGVSLRELIDAKHPETWKTFELGQCDEATLFAEFFADGRSFDGPALKATMREAYAFIDGVQSLLAELKLRGVAMHTLSNYPQWYSMIEDELSLSKYVSWSFVSCEMGVRKPDPEAFLKPARSLGVAPEHCLFVDDRESNCEGARAVGMSAAKFEDAATLRTQLVALGVL